MISSLFESKSNFVFIKLMNFVKFKSFIVFIWNAHSSRARFSDWTIKTFFFSLNWEQNHEREMHDDFVYYCNIRETFNAVAVRRRNALFFKLMLLVFCFVFDFFFFLMIVIASSRQKFEIMISLFHIYVIK